MDIAWNSNAASTLNRGNGKFPAFLASATGVLAAGTYECADTASLSIVATVVGPMTAQGRAPVLNDETITVDDAQAQLNGSQVGTMTGPDGPASSVQFPIFLAGQWVSPGDTATVVTVTAEGEVQNSHEGEDFQTYSGTATLWQVDDPGLPAPENLVPVLTVRSGQLLESFSTDESGIKGLRLASPPDGVYTYAASWELEIDWNLDGGFGFWGVVPTGIYYQINDPVFDLDGPGPSPQIVTTTASDGGPITIGPLDPGDTVYFLGAPGQAFLTVEAATFVGSVNISGTMTPAQRGPEEVALTDADYRVAGHPVV